MLALSLDGFGKRALPLEDQAEPAEHLPQVRRGRAGPDDPRVKAALKWVRKHYGLETNPGIGSAGLYYYYHTFAKALDAAGLDEIEDADGVKHRWRQDLLSELARRQQPDGSWINEDSRWLEGDPSLVTGYALLALAYGRPEVQK